MAPDKMTDHKQETQEIQDQPIDMESNEILNSEITMEELCKNIRNLKRRKAAAEDKITNELLIYTNQQLKEIILKVYNECLSHGVCPWNTALITPLHKKGDKSDPNNYILGNCCRQQLGQAIFKHLIGSPYHFQAHLLSGSN
jgi:hypothetical protein